MTELVLAFLSALPEASAANALQWTLRLLAVSLAIQSAELLRLAPAFSELGIWRESTLRDELRGGLRVLAPLFGQRMFLGLQALRLVGAFGLGALSLLVGPDAAQHPFPPTAGALLAILLATSVVTNLRFRGTFNGGSDFMTLVVLTAMLVAALSPAGAHRIQDGSLWYIALHVCASYFVAGWIKILKPHWRSGRALRGFLSTTIYAPSAVWRRLHPSSAAASAMMLLLAWAVMLWEITFPAALFEPRAAFAALALGVFFHLGNVLFFGLNRFFFAWLAAYPAVIFAAHSLQNLN